MILLVLGISQKQVVFFTDVSYDGNSGWNANGLTVEASGNFDDHNVNNTYGVRPCQIPTTISKCTNALKIYVYECIQKKQSLFTKDNLINRLETSLFRDENQKKRYRCF